MGAGRLREIEEGTARGRALIAWREHRWAGPPQPPLEKGGRGLWAGLRSLAWREQRVRPYPPWPPFVRGAKAARWRTLTEGREQRLRPTPVAPLRKGGEGGALADAY